MGHQYLVEARDVAVGGEHAVAARTYPDDRSGAIRQDFVAHALVLRAVNEDLQLQAVAVGARLGHPAAPVVALLEAPVVEADRGPPLRVAQPDGTADDDFGAARLGPQVGDAYRDAGLRVGRQSRDGQLSFALYGVEEVAPVRIARRAQHQALPAVEHLGQRLVLRPSGNSHWGYFFNPDRKSTRLNSSH